MAKIYLNSGNSNFLVANNGSQVFGGLGTESVFINAGVTGIDLDSSVETVLLSGNVSDYTYSQTGVALNVYLGGVLVTTFDSPNMNPVFADGAVDIGYVSGAMDLGGTALVDNATAIAIVPATIDTTTTSNINTTGIVSDGYISGATVFADANDDGVWNEGEAKTTTDVNGDFTLAGGTGSLVATGGTDISTGLAFEGTFTAPEGSTTVSPLTTLVDKIMKATPALTAEEAVAQVATALGLDSSINLLTFDPIAAALDTTLTPAQQAAAVATQAAAVQVVNMMSQAAAMMSGAGIATEAEGALAAAASLASMISEAATSSNPADAVIDLGSPTTVKTFLQASAVEAGATTEQIAAVELVSASIATATANINTVMADAVTNAPAGTSTASIFTQLAQVQIAAEDNENLAESAAESGDTSAVEAEGDVSSLESASGITPTPTPTPTPTRILTDTTAPTVSNIAITSATGLANNTLNNSDVVSITVTMDSNVNVTGTPQLGLNIGGSTVQASYSSGTGTSALVFTYTINNESDSNGISIDANALALNGGTITDAAGNAASLTHSLIADNASYLVDTTAPVVDATIPIETNDADSNEAYSDGDVITLKFAEPIEVSSLAIANLSVDNGHTLGTATLAAVSPSDGYATTFTVTLANADATVAGGDIISVAFGNVVDDIAGNSTGAPLTFTIGYLAPLNVADAITAYNSDNLVIYSISDTQANIDAFKAHAAINQATALVINNTTIDAAIIVGIDTATTTTVDVTAATTITGTGAEVTTAYAATTITGLANEIVTVSDTISATDANVISAATTGDVTATLISDDTATINTSLVNSSETDALTITANNFSTDIADLIGLNAKTSVDVVASSVVTITSAATNTIDLTATGIIWASGINVTGTTGDDTITGTAETDYITGGTGDDTINGGTGWDYITGGAGADIIDGSADKDNYRYTSATDSFLNDTAVAATGYDTVTVYATNGLSDYFTFFNNATVVIASKVNEGSAVDVNGDDLLASLSAAFEGADDDLANVEAGVIAYTSGEQFLVVDIDSSGTITTDDVVIELVGTFTGIYISGSAVSLVA